ncbi:hypothetical protein GW17_00041175 [Ensete ventricosum]|nr:hypothetical protein GW17_00041175 [Ensete ventricosum]RZS02508.1 hypothetical protein BHM03_00032579 [Ensete ventricosum]
MAAMTLAMGAATASGRVFAATTTAKDVGSGGCWFQEIDSNEEEEDGGARYVLPRDGLQIGKTTLSFDSKEIAMAIGAVT